MKKFLFFAVFLTGIVCKAQIKNVSIRAGANYPLIKSIESRDNVATIPIPAATGYVSSTIGGIGVEESFSSRVGFQAGGSFDYYLTKRFFVNTGIALSYLQYKRTAKITQMPAGIETTQLFPVVTVGQPFGTFYGVPVNPNGGTVLTPPNLYKNSNKHGNTTALFVQLPMLVGTTIFKDKLQVKTGAIFSYLISAKEVKTKYTATTASISEYKDSSKASFNEFQAGVAIETSYLIGKQIGIDFTAQKFLTTIYKDRPEDENTRYNILSVGISYTL